MKEVTGHSEECEIADMDTDENMPKPERESELNYDAIYVMAEKCGIRDPKQYLRIVVAKAAHQLVKDGIVTYDEIFHEAVVGLYLGIREYQEDESVKIRLFVWGRIRDYKREIIGRRYESGRSHDIPFSELTQDPDDNPEDMADRLKFRIQVETTKDKTESLVQSDQYVERLTREVKQCLNEYEKKEGQGKRDWEVFLMFILGDTLDDICASCGWLKTTNSARKSLTRIINTVRKHFGNNEMVKTVTIGEETHLVSGDETFDKNEYYRQWYKKNKEEKRKKSREYMRQKRGEGKTEQQ